MTKLGDIEEALASGRTPELLTVYGDALQSIGDPRGDLIAIDLHVAAHGPSAELAASKREQIDRWLGAELAARVLAIGAVDHGFVNLRWGLGADELERVLANPALHAALRELAIEDHDPGLRRAIDLVCARPPPWLEHLQVVRYPDAFDASLREAVAIDDDRAQALVRATPRLRQLTIAGANAVGELVHPHVRTVCVYDYNAFGSLLRGGAPLPSVHELDFQFGDDPGAERPASLLPPERLPALRRLDLARNEALWRDLAFALVGTHPIMRQVVWLRVPSLRTDAHLEALERAVAGMGADAEVIVARAYAEHLPTRVPSPRIHVPVPRPWPPSDAIRGRGALTITVPGQRDQDVELRDAIGVMEAQFDALAEPARASWSEFWLSVRRLPPEARGGNAVGFELAAGALADALAPLELGDYQKSWRGLRTVLAERTGDTLYVRRWSLWG
jgi:hypothetical protein